MILQRWVAAVIVLLAVLLALNFNSRLAMIRQLRQDEARLKQAVTDEEARQAELKSLRGYVASDSYVEHWARVQARMVRPGEITVIPVAPKVAQPDPHTPAPVHAPATILDEWWALFFDATGSVP